MSRKIAPVTKSEVISQLKLKLEEQVAVMKSALADSAESASGDETKSEGKYDTRAVEASYLAQAQDGQLALAEKSAATFSRFEAEDFDISDEIAIGALVEVDEEGEIRFFFLAPTGGGLVIDYLGCELTVITPDSRLYQEMVGKKMGEEIESPPLLITGLE
ncbi:hypothetical protein N9268_00865 [Akkermansiaceae bacterium]|nr:hypothetical protein [Akkermansiaceae bacterium]MDB4451639.1 hypothetical protein [Akkermansiaceae bacterium]MDB4506373.1 hypothetical protein [bacterium]MDB4545909.1 hypothetical protein [Akkermansiaceae bacterium]MDB4578109.1 hypothetical protein [Akkermansiaceae bacterium]